MFFCKMVLTLRLILTDADGNELPFVVAGILSDAKAESLPPVRLLLTTTIHTKSLRSVALLLLAWIMRRRGYFERPEKSAA